MTIQKELARKTPKRKALYTLIASGLLTVASLDAMAQTGNPRVNQLGYVPNGAKTATYKTTSTSAQTWQLKQNGSVVATGQTIPFGADAASGDNLHQIDLSSVTATGTGFSLTVGSDSSYNFAISANVLSAALYDSLKYFYHNRSGIAIETQYTGGGNGSFASNSKWARPAGHINVGANKGDLNVPCWTGTCNYTLNVSKGWYDAGDHGKYVVNGGISVWTLLNLYERSLYLGNNSPSVSDGKLNIPESANGIPDILDEARWEMEFLLGMQVPAGQTKAGMVHHKMHDVGWTGFPLAPHEDSQARALVPPSTAATLNLAATAAQAARIWRDLDSGFAEVCLTAAQRAWDAAQANPADIYTSGYDNGGGAYGDRTVADEFYWAAAELYITTGESKYLSTLNNRTILQTNFGWADTDLAGLISLAIVPAGQTASLRSAAQQKIVSIADLHIATQNTSGYPAPSSVTDYYWGSNGSVANKLILLGLAYDFTKNDTYAKGVGKGLNFFFGQNTQSTSFITGEGTKTVTQPHHRFWANATSSSYPTPPPGAFSGGPNAGLEDPKSAVELASCVSKPATCWMDHIEAYAVNEITINWNAPLAWNLAFYNDYAASNNGTSSSSSISSSSVASSSLASSSLASSSLASSSIASSSIASSIASSSSVRSSSSSSIVASSSSSSLRSSSSIASSSSVRSSSSSASGQQCNWYGNLYPLCVTTTNGWGYENSKSCISRSTCASQPAPFGIVGEASSSSSSAANRAPTAVITYTQEQRCPRQGFTISAAGSSDADGDSLTYEWVLEGYGSAQTYTGITIEVGLRPVTRYTVTLTVKDGKGGVSTATQALYHSSTDNCTSSSSGGRSSSSVVSSSSSVVSSSSSVVSSSSSVRSSSSSIASTGAKCTYVVTNQWNNGFTGAVRITNNGTSAISGWNVSWSYSDGSKITNSWNGTLSGSNPYSASGLNWNSTIQPGQTAEFGFQGTKGNSAAQTPTVTGSICQ
jgi:endoglucanase